MWYIIDFKTFEITGGSPSNPVSPIVSPLFEIKKKLHENTHKFYCNSEPTSLKWYFTFTQSCKSFLICMCTNTPNVPLNGQIYNSVEFLLKAIPPNVLPILTQYLLTMEMVPLEEIQKKIKACTPA